ncbi:hypothetical protein [Paenibacillus ehimensis]|uniref:Uncharacterized protein n=1 Tax=Paenibacillus ehimensis TaxID=79264 RepID=A0ABT8VMF6_9BACL|nr:hypothetical protein [Paenibacillus ehimensis]MDO3682142.1 hypothetical protein [Paenibacillus ehimensis]
MSASLALTLCFSGSSVFADAPKETEQSLLRKAEQKRNLDKQVLKDQGIKDDVIAKLESNIDIVASLIKPQGEAVAFAGEEGLNDQQLKNLIDGLTTPHNRPS